jgi:drug/metabolite transporter (DMT)-like permease
MADARKKLVAYALLALACTFWGSSFVLGKFAIREMPALDISFWRSLMAAVIFAFVLFRKRIVPSAADVRSFILVGALMIPVTYLLQFGALHYINAASAAVIIGVEPLTIALASYLFFGTRLTARILAAGVLAAVGVYVLFGDRLVAGSSSLIGYAMVLASTVVVAGWVVLTKKLLAQFDSVVSTAYISITGFILLLAVVPWVNLDVTRYSAATWITVVALTVSSSILGNLFWNMGLRHVNSESAGVFLALEPIAGVLLAVLFLNEIVTGALLLSLLLVVLAILMATTPPRIPATAAKAMEAQAPGS